MKFYRLTDRQQKSFDALQKAFDDCAEACIYLWVYNGSICAVNGNVVKDVGPMDADLGEQIDFDQIEIITGTTINQCADDTIYIKRRT